MYHLEILYQWLSLFCLQTHKKARNIPKNSSLKILSICIAKIRKKGKNKNAMKNPKFGLQIVSSAAARAEVTQRSPSLRGRVRTGSVA